MPETSYIFVAFQRTALLVALLTMLDTDSYLNSGLLTFNLKIVAVLTILDADSYMKALPPITQKIVAVLTILDDDPDANDK